MVLSTAGNLGIGNNIIATNALSVEKSIANDYVVEMKQLYTTTNNSYGLNIQAGTSASDIAFRITTHTVGEVFRVRGDGFVGIGVLTPVEKLTVFGQVASTSSSSTVSTAGANRAIMDLTGGGARMGHFRGATAAGSGFLRLFTDSVERMRIDSAGNVGIGVSNPVSYGKFVVQGTGNLINANATSGAATFQLYEGGQGRFAITTLNGSAGAKFELAGNEKMRIDSNGTVIINATAPRQAYSTTAPTKISVQGGMSEFETTLNNKYDFQNSPISILERANIDSGSADNKYSPNLNFHWSGRVSNSLWMSANGHLNYGSYTSAGIPAADGTFKAGNFKYC